MTRILQFAVASLVALPRYNDIAVGNMTDSQLRRSGQTKAQILHRTFSGLHGA